jgi:hypothetical protein
MKVKYIRICEVFDKSKPPYLFGLDMFPSEGPDVIGR